MGRLQGDSCLPQENVLVDWGGKRQELADAGSDRRFHRPGRSLSKVPSEFKLQILHQLTF